MFNDCDNVESGVFKEIQIPKDFVEPEEEKGASLILVMIVAAIITLAVLLVVFWPGATANAGEIPKVRAVDAIIGEAEGEGLEGMRLVAHAIRNRGGLVRVYGERSKRVREHLYSAKVFVNAVRAWEESKNEPDPTYGANSWYSRQDLRKDPEIIDRCRVRKVYGNQIFLYCEGI